MIRCLAFEFPHMQKVAALRCCFLAMIVVLVFGGYTPIDARIPLGAGLPLPNPDDLIHIDMRPTSPQRLPAWIDETVTHTQTNGRADAKARPFHVRFRGYMRDIWPEETATLTDAALDATVARAIAAAQQLDLEPQSNVVVNFVVIEMVAPHVIADAIFYIDQVKDRVAPSGYSNILLMVAVSALPAERAEVVSARASFWPSYP
jgi:hypothetical protein